MPFNPFSSDTKAPVTGDASTKSEDVQDILNILGDDETLDDTEPKKSTTRKTSAKDDEDEDDKKTRKDKEEEDEDELEIKEPDDEDEKKLTLKKDEDEEIEVDTPPRKRDILKKYPKFFEEYPWFEKMMFRDREMQQLFGSFDEAKEAHERSSVLDEFESHLMKGDSEQLFRQIKENNSEAYTKIIDNLMPMLYKLDKDAYFSIASDFTSRIVQNMFLEGKKLENEELQQAAILVNQFVNGTSEFKPPKKFNQTGDRDDKKSSVDEEREAFYQERFSDSVNQMQVAVGNTLKNTINEYIDPRNEMTAFVKKNAVREALTEIDENIASDSYFRKQLDRLWESAKKEKFSRSSLDRIKSTYLGKAKSHLKTAIIKARKEALKDLSPRREKEEEKDRKGPLSPGHSRPNRTGKSEGMKPGESVLEFLARD